MNAQKDSLSKMIADNTGEIESLKAGMEKAEKAIEEAVGESEGTMSEKIAAEVKTINGRIDSVSKDINDKLAALGTRVSNLENDLKTLKNNYERRIQSLTHVPTYSDGVEKYEVTVISGEFKRCRDLTLRFEVKPHSAAGSVTKEQVAVNAVHTITKASAGDIRNLDIKSLSADAETGVLTLVIDPIDLYKASVENGLSSGVRIALTDPSGLYDFASEYVNGERIPDPGVLSYKTNDNQKIDFYRLKVYDPDGNESELIHEFADGIWTIYSLDEAAVLDINYGPDIESKTLTDIHVNKPVSLCSDASSCFASCDQLTTAGFGLVDTREVTSMQYMFLSCGSLSSLDLSGWDTKNVTHMLYMFSECRSLESLDLSGWDMRSVKDMSGMFKDCVNVKTITMKGCDDETVRKIEEALTDARIRGKVTIIRE